jgi:hypothetical protein
VEHQGFFKSAADCPTQDRLSLANLLSFPDGVSLELLEDMTNPSENIFSEIYYSDNHHVMGGYIAEFVPAYNMIYVRELAINSKFKSKSYGREIFHRIGEMGLDIYQAEFKGILTSCLCLKNKKSFDEKNAYKLRAAINSGGKIIVECAKVKNNYLHFVCIGYNGGRDEGEIKEVFRKNL